ncbi:MAG TPA: VCBS repeat-containing protein [Verrucomicrobiae bacterium]|jgi:hypothetical protein|nr:VCBS repeat-containing protein [Verrucomicrobiae bacterium]
MRTISLLGVAILFALSIGPSAKAEEINVEAQGFAMGGNILPSPAPQIDERLNRSDWPRLVLPQETAGYAEYPIRRAFLDLSIQDWNQDGRPDLLYLKKNNGTFIITVFLNKSGTFEFLSDFSFSSTPDAIEIAPLILDFDGDGRNDLLLIERHPFTRFVSTERLRYAIYWGSADGFADAPLVPKESDLPPAPRYVLQNKKSGIYALVTAQNTLLRPTKKALTRLLLKKSVLFKINFISLTNKRVNSVCRYDFNGGLEEEDFLGKAGEWRPVTLPEVHHWEKREKENPKIFYDWNGDGTVDIIEIFAGEEHVVIDGRTQREMARFKLDRNNLMTGNFVDLNGDKKIEEVDITPRENGMDVKTDVTVRHTFDGGGEEKYTFEGLLLFPQSFVDVDGDGDLDALCVKPPSQIRDLLKQMIAFVSKRKSRAEILVYDQGPRGFSRKPDERRKVLLAGSLARLRSFADLL